MKIKTALQKELAGKDQIFECISTVIELCFQFMEIKRLARQKMSDCVI